MMLRDQFELAIRTLARHKLRTALTMLGMIIGVATIIVLTSLALGARSQVEREIALLGTNLLSVHPTRRSLGAVQSSTSGHHRLSEDDAVAIVREVAGAELAVPVVTGSVRLILAEKNWPTTIVGTHPDYLAVRDWNTSSGRNFSIAEVAGSAKVILVGQTIAEQLSPYGPITGKLVRVNQVPFRVVGVLDRKGQSVAGQDQDNVVIAPISTVKSRLIGGYYQDNRRAAAYLLVKGSDEQQLPLMRADIERVLKARHGLNTGQAADFSVRDPVAALSASKSASESLTLLLGCISAISLLVGGISVMNIMLASVAERAREIGIRMVVGANKLNVRLQFLTEAATVALVGGALGTAIGISASVLLEVLLGWTMHVNAWICIGALVFAGGIGMASGLYPAIKASALDPLDAIRG